MIQTKYFCDRCEEETKELNSYSIHTGEYKTKLYSIDLCCKCAIELRLTVSYYDRNNHPEEAKKAADLTPVEVIELFMTVVKEMEERIQDTEKAIGALE